MSAYQTVYNVHCKTFAVLKDLWQLPENLATRPDHPVMLFRVVPSHRCSQSLLIRKMVADKVRKTRKQSNQEQTA